MVETYTVAQLNDPVFAREPSVQDHVRELAAGCA
jgi:hypothetical protein